MEGKPIWQSKTVWVAIVTGLLAMVGPVSQAAGHPVVIPNYVYEVLAGLGLYALRDGQGVPLK